MIKRIWLSIERYFLFHLIRLFRIRGQNERVARGFALGLIVNLFPTFGFGVIISGFVARICGGKTVAGFVGGAAFAFFWPVLFYLNVRVGQFFVQPPIVIDEFGDVTPKTVDALVWGRTFMAGAIANSVLIGGVSYLILRVVHWRIRPAALAYFRRHARDHQQRFGRPKINSRAGRVLTAQK
jgi:uncharacterized protein (DUF2062 family)